MRVIETLANRSLRADLSGTKPVGFYYYYIYVAFIPEKIVCNGKEVCSCFSYYLYETVKMLPKKLYKEKKEREKERIRVASGEERYHMDQARRLDCCNFGVHWPNDGCSLDLSGVGKHMKHRLQSINICSSSGGNAQISLLGSGGEFYTL